MAFNYEEAKRQYGAQRARQMEQQANQVAPPAPAPPPPPTAQTAGAPRPAAPPPPPPPAGANVPRPDMSGFVGPQGAQRWMQASGGTQQQYDQFMNQWRGGQAPPPPAPPAPAPPATGGQPNQFHVGQGRADGSVGGQNSLANMTPEQRIQYSMQNIDSLDKHGDANRAREQWAIWQRSYDPACPDQFPYQAEDGSGCVEKPDNSNDPNAGGRQNLPGGVAGNRGGGGGGRGGQGRATTTATSGVPQGQISDTIWQQIQKDLLQPQSRYTPEAMAAMEADQFARARRQEQLQLEESRRDAAMRGVSRGGEQAAALRGIRTGTGQQIMATHADIARQKVDADFQDRQAAIQNSMNYLNSLRQYMLQSDMNSIQREQLAAQIQMAERQLRWQTAENDRSYQRNLSTFAYTGGGGTF